LYENSITGKWLGMLKEISPHPTRAALVANPKGFTYDYLARSSKTIAPALGIEVTPMPIDRLVFGRRLHGKFGRVGAAQDTIDLPTSFAPRQPQRDKGRKQREQSWRGNGKEKLAEVRMCGLRHQKERRSMAYFAGLDVSVTLDRSPGAARITAPDDSTAPNFFQR
jgi:hypothetical protein